MMSQANLLHKILNDGNAMRLCLEERAEGNRIKSYTNQLVYHLKNQDEPACIETIIRQYLHLHKQVPHTFIKTLQNDTLFLAAGYAYLAGLNGAAKK